MSVDWGTVIIGIAGSIGGGGMVMFLAKTLISRALQKQDNFDSKLDAVIAVVSDIKTDMAVVKRDISHALELRAEVKADHDKIVVLEQKMIKNKDDIDSAWIKIRSKA